MTFGVVPELRLRADSPIPKFLQLKSQLEYLIVTGELPPGKRLPSIREMARALHVGPATVVRGYQELERAGLVVSNQGVGHFVVGVEPEQTEPHAQIREKVTELLQEALHEGVGIDQVLQIFLAQVADMRVSLASPELIVLCKQDGRVQELAMHLRHALADLGVEVSGIAVEELERDVEGWIPRLRKARCVASLLFDVKQARTLLDPYGIEVVPLLGTIRDDARDRIIHLPAGTRLGVVSVSLEFVDGMITAITTLNPNVDVVASCAASNSRALRRMVKEVDCVVHGTLGRHAVQEVLPRSTEAIEFLYIPDDASVQRLRRILREPSG